MFYTSKIAKEKCWLLFVILGRLEMKSLYPIFVLKSHKKKLSLFEKVALIQIKIV